MPRFKNVSPWGWDVEVFDGTRRIDVAFGDEFDVTDEEAKNPLFTKTAVFERVETTGKGRAKAGEGDK